jgi:hypothetical protein
MLQSPFLGRGLRAGTLSAFTGFADFALRGAAVFAGVFLEAFNSGSSKIKAPFRRTSQPEKMGKPFKEARL